MKTYEELQGEVNLQIRVISNQAQSLNDAQIINANLRVINTELLEALQTITETFKSCLGGSDPLYYEDFKEEIKRAEAAINKATL